MEPVAERPRRVKRVLEDQVDSSVLLDMAEKLGGVVAGVQEMKDHLKDVSAGQRQIAASQEEMHRELGIVGERLNGMDARQVEFNQRLTRLERTNHGGFESVVKFLKENGKWLASLGVIVGGAIWAYVRGGHPKP